MYGPKPLPESVRFWRNVNKTSTHWLWTGGQNSAGYGAFRVGSQRDGTRRMMLAHHWSWEQVNGPIIGELDHLPHCRVRNCIRPDHLQDVTHQVNILRGQTIPAGHAAKTVCGVCGAPYYAKRNTQGSRVCTQARHHPKGRKRGLP